MSPPTRVFLTLTQAPFVFQMSYYFHIQSTMLASINASLSLDLKRVTNRNNWYFSSFLDSFNGLSLAFDRWDKPVREDRHRRQRENPSFSSTFLDAIYRSTHEGHGKERKDKLVLYRESNMKKKQSGLKSNRRKWRAFNKHAWSRSGWKRKWMTRSWSAGTP